MIRRFALGLGTAVLCAATVGWAQAPQAQEAQGQQPEARQTRTDDSSASTVTMIGCLREEGSVPGSTPNVAERAGVGEDFILTNVTTRSEQGGTTASAEPGAPQSGTPGAVGTSGAGASPASDKKYKVEGLDDERLRQHVGRRVEVTGRLEARTGHRGAASSSAGAGSQAGEAAGTPAGERPGTPAGGQAGAQTEGHGAAGSANRAAQGNDLPEIEATSIRTVAGDCPAAR